MEERKDKKIKTLISSGAAAAAEAIRGTDRGKLRELALPAAKAAAAALCAFLFASKTAAYSSYPFLFALLGSLGTNVIPALAGASVAALFNKGLAVWLCAACSSLVLLRFALCRLLCPKGEIAAPFRERPVLRIASAGTVAALFSLYRIAANGFLFYDMFGAAFTLVSVPVLCLLFSFYFDRAPGARFYAGMYALLFSLCFSLKHVSVFNLSAATAAAFFAGLFISKSEGPFRAALGGLFCGAAVSPACALAFAVSSLIPPFLYRRGTVPAVFGSCAAASVCLIYAEGYNAVFAYMPEILVSALMFIPLSKYVKSSPLTGKMMPGAPLPISQSTAAAEYRRKETEGRILAISGAMASLAETFFMLSDKSRRPGISEIRSTCEQCMEKNCRKCSGYSLCWSKEYLSTSDFVNKLAETLYSLGRIEKDMIPQYMADRCPNIDDILDELNCANTELLRSRMNGNKSEVFAIDYEQMSKLLAQAIVENGEEYEKDDDLSEKAARLLGYLNINCSWISVCAGRRKNVFAYGIDLSGMRCSAEELRSRFERVCGVKYKLPKFNIDRDCVSMSIEADRRFAAVAAHASSAKEDEQFNGDHFCVFDNRRDCFYALLDDGMGCGREAALSSRLSGLFLRKMLGAGNKKNISLEMLNHILRQKDGECSSTVDLLEIDMTDGSASFIKSGAAPSYILRDGRIYSINSDSMPVGITKEINAEEIKFELKENDIVIMMSDGIAPSFEDGLWVADLLGHELEKGSDLQQIADKVLLNAGIGNSRSDDMTVGIIQLKRNR